jgi:hypothetical protein
MPRLAGDGEGRLVRLAVAAPFFGVHHRTLRRRVEEGSIPVERMADGALAVRVPDRPRRFVLVPHRLRPDPRLRLLARRERLFEPARLGIELEEPEP